MKNLWTVLPPLLSDNSGLTEVVKNSDGCAVVDDSGDIRPGGGHGQKGRMDGGRREHGGHGGRGERAGHAGHGGRGGHGGGKGGSARVIVSGASAQDVTTGTRDALMNAFQSARLRYDPSFVLLSAGPCGAMIGTDLKEVAETITGEYHIPAAAVDLTGQKPYDTGISKTIEAMARLLASPGEVRPGTLNILGATALDWSAADVAAVSGWAEQQGWQVLASPGTSVTAAQLSDMGRSQLNWAVTVSGLAAARYLQSQFGTPFVAGAPFGAMQLDGLAARMQSPEPPAPAQQAGADALIIGEQFTANALRGALENRGLCAGADVATFYLLDKAFARSGDRRLKGEADARALLNSGKYRLIAADPALRPLLSVDCVWIDLPHRAMTPYGEGSSLPLFGSRLDEWLDSRR